MLDNGDGAVRCGLNGFPSANIPANCSGTVTFADKQSQSTLPVKSYQLVIDSCSVIDQQSGEMEMHLALIVDGYKFVQTGYNFRQLPNSQAQLALPEWELISEPATPVRLITILNEYDGSYPLGVEMSDGSYRALVDPSQSNYVIASGETDGVLVVDVPGSCDGDLGITTYEQEFSEAVKQDYQTLGCSYGFNSCSVQGQSQLTFVPFIEVDGVRFVGESVTAAIMDTLEVDLSDLSAST